MSDEVNTHEEFEQTAQTEQVTQVKAEDSVQEDTQYYVDPLVQDTQVASHDDPIEEVYLGEKSEVTSTVPDLIPTDHSAPIESEPAPVGSQASQSAESPESAKPTAQNIIGNMTAPVRTAFSQAINDRKEKDNHHSVPRARRMKLSITHVDPWSVTKVSFMLAIALVIIQLVAVVFLWYVVDAIGMFDSLTSILSSAGLSSGSIDIASFVSLGRVVSIFTIIGIFEIVIITVLGAINAFLYNIVSALVGGIHVTLGDD